MVKIVSIHSAVLLQFTED